MRKLLSTTLPLLAGAIATLPIAAQAQEPYVIGLLAGITGPANSDYAPPADAMRIYFDEVNQRGGINGHPVEVQVRDTQGQPSRAGVEMDGFVNDDDVLLVVNSGLSSTYAPVMSKAKRRGIPLLFGGGVCPEEVFPPADPLLFCTTGFSAQLDSEFAVDFIQQESGGDARIGLVSMAIPISRAGMEHAQEYAKAKGMEVALHETVPPPTPNYAPFAAKLQEAGVTWGLSWAPWVTEVKTFEALRQIGWEGSYLAYGHTLAETELERLKDPAMMVFGANAMFASDLPIHQAIRAAAKDKTRFPVSYLSEGWVAAMAVEAALQKVAWPPSREQVAIAMNDLSIDTRGLRGGPIVWSAKNHFRNELFYRVYRWNADESRIEVVRDWVRKEIE